jgi:molybdopterin synthase sulfur carrier subunit
MTGRQLAPVACSLAQRDPIPEPEIRRSNCRCQARARLYGSKRALFPHSNPLNLAARRPHLLHYITMSKVHIPTPLRQYVGKQASVEVKGSTVGEAMNALVAQHPDLRKHLYTEDGKLRAFVNLYLNDEDIRYLQKEATALKDGDNISIVPSIAGGVA